MNKQVLLDQIPAYVLDTLSEEERLQVETFLNSDVEARTFLAEYQEVMDTLAFSAPRRNAPPALRSKLQQRLTLPYDEIETTNVIAPRSIQSSGKLISWPAFMSIAAAVFILVIAGVLQFVGPDNNRTRSEREILYHQIIEQADSQRLAAVTDIAGVEAEIVVTASGQQAVLRLAELPVLEDTQAFQLWLIDNDEARQSGGIFQWSKGHGPYFIVMPLEKPFMEYAGFGMSIEPADGSPLGNAPTGPRVWGLALETSSRD